MRRTTSTRTSAVPPTMRAMLGVAIASSFLLVVNPGLAVEGGEAERVETVSLVPAIVSAEDLGATSRFQDVAFGHHKRGRATIAADFDLDGVTDFYIGNPGDESFILRGTVTATGDLRYEPAQILVSEDLVWGAVGSDFDNDGDVDLFLANGGNEGVGHDYLFTNRYVESGRLWFEDVTTTAGVAGPIPEGGTEPLTTASANAVVADYDRDGDTDIFVNTNMSQMSPPQLLGRNTLWENNGDGTFVDVTEARGLGTTAKPTRHSTFLDVDNDGDVDLLENNFGTTSVLWRNLLVETGIPDFEDATAEMSLPGEDLAYPAASFASAAADFNNDGWEDLIVFARGAEDPPVGPYQGGHAIFINQRGGGFMNMAEEARLNTWFIADHGVMGCQVGDINADGTPDVYVGNGSPDQGTTDQLFLSTSAVGRPPTFDDATSLIGFTAPELANLEYPTYPYRTHGTAILDVTGDGLNEIAVANGGPAAYGDFMQEPNRLFTFAFDTEPATFRVRPVGDGLNVSRDAIGTRVAVEAGNDAGDRWHVHRTLFGGSCFSAQNGFELTFGLADATDIVRVTVFWPDGTLEHITDGLEVGGVLTVQR